MANITTNAPYTCTTQTLSAANCSLFACTGDLTGTGAVQAQSAGVITLTDGTTPITIMPDATKTYTEYLDFSHAAWPADTQLTVSAAGADVPAFSGHLTTGTSPTFSAPSVTPGMTIPRNSPLHLAWTGGTTGKVWVTVDGKETTSALARVICSFPVASGSGDVPVEGLMMIAAGPGTFALDVGEHVKLTAGDFNVNLAISTSSMMQDGGVIVGAVTATIQ